MESKNITTQELAQEISELRAELERMQAVNEIQNVMANYTIYHAFGRHKECLKQFAMHTPDVSVEIAMWGRFVGPQSVFKNYIGMAMAEGDRIGMMCDHPIATPLVQVAKNGLTAKCIWTTFGTESLKDPDGKIEPLFMYGKFAVEFIKENGRWKIWHFHILPDLMFHQNIPYTETKPHHDPNTKEYGAPDDAPQPDEPTTFCEEYSADTARKFWPQPPLPYDTYESSRPVISKPPEDCKLVYKKEYNDITFEEFMRELEREKA